MILKLQSYNRYDEIRCFYTSSLKVLFEDTSQISIGILLQIVAPEYFTEFNPYLVVLTVGFLNVFYWKR